MASNPPILPGKAHSLCRRGMEGAPAPESDSLRPFRHQQLPAKKKKFARSPLTAFDFRARLFAAMPRMKEVTGHSFYPQAVRNNTSLPNRAVPQRATSAIGHPALLPFCAFPGPRAAPKPLFTLTLRFAAEVAPRPRAGGIKFFPLGEIPRWICQHPAAPGSFSVVRPFHLTNLINTPEYCLPAKLFAKVSLAPKSTPSTG